MKREYEDDGPIYNKRRNNGEEEVTLLIPSRMAGSIIGKGGANITRLRNKYKATITIPDCPGPERVLTIALANPQTVLEVVKKILPNLVDNQQGGRNNNEDLDLRLLIHQSRAGCVIGKAGSKIKELRERTGARMKIFSNTAPQSTERVLQILGDETEIADGLREVLELIQRTPIKPPIVPYDPHNYDDFYADEYGGFGGGQNGPPGPQGPRGPPQSRGPPPRMNPMIPGRGGPMIRPPMGRNSNMGPRAFNNDFGPRNNFSGPPRGGNFGGNRNGGRDGFNENNGGNQAEQSTQVTIPKDLAGAIIGKSGSRIRKIRAESGAGIEIAEPLPDARDRIITITGTPHAIQMAQYLLQQSVHESNPGLARGNKF